MRTSLLPTISLLLLVGCAHPLDVYVIDGVSRAPIAGATVCRVGMQRPYFIAGAIVPKEVQVTDADGVAHMKDRREGPLVVVREGYEHGGANLYDCKAPSIAVELKRLGGGR